MTLPDVPRPAPVDLLVTIGTTPRKVESMSMTTVTTGSATEAEVDEVLMSMLETGLSTAEVGVGGYLPRMAPVDEDFPQD